MTRFLVVASLGLALLASGAAAEDNDDFAFGQALAVQGRKTGDAGYFTYARKVYEAVIANPNASEGDKELCRYGIAELVRDQAVGAIVRTEIPYAEVKSLFLDAVKEMERFAEKNPSHARANEARLGVGTTRLAFVGWARDNLLPDPEEIQTRKTTPQEIVADATEMVNGAISYFDKLRGAGTRLSDVAEYYWVMSQYYRALVFPEGSDQAREAFKDAGKKLENFITLNEGTLLSAYAQDYYGLVFWELAKLARSEEDKEAMYRSAVEWFETCIETPVESLDELQVVASGYYHMGQVCVEAGRVGGTNFYRVGLGFLGAMLERQSGVTNVDKGLRAVYEHARLENALERTDRAVEITKQGIDLAHKQGKQYLVNIGNRLLRNFVGVGGTLGTGDPEVLKGVADNLYLEQKYTEAIRAYQGAIAAVGRRTLASFEKFLLPCWQRLAGAYEKEGDMLSAALALEPIHEAWMDGLIPRVGGENDPKMIEYGNIRRRAMVLWRDLGQETESSAYTERYKDVERTFIQDYPDHPTGKIGIWNTARELFEEGKKQKRANNPAWKDTLRRARQAFEQISQDMSSEKLDTAFTYMVMIAFEMDDWNEMLATSAKAHEFWASEVAKAQEEKFPTVRARRKAEMGYVDYWRAEAHYNLKQYAEVLAISEVWRTEYEELKDKSNGFFYNGILSLRILALLAMDDIEGADKPYRRLLKDDPGFYRLQAITFQLAEFYNKQQAEIQKGLKDRLVQLKGTAENPNAGARTRLRELEQSYTRSLLFLGDQQNEMKKAKELVQLYDEGKAKGELPPNITDAMYREGKEKVARLGQEIPSLQARLNEMTAQKETLEREVDTLTQESRELSQKLYEPLVKAAGYYTDYTNALIESKLPLDRDNVRIFADMWYRAGRLRPQDAANWNNSRSLYEKYLELSKGQDDDNVSEAQGRLGRIYYRLAVSETDEAARAKLVKDALDRLEATMAKSPENLSVLVGHLKGDYVVIPWVYRRGDNQRYRFALPRVKDVAQFQQAVKNLGKPGGTPLPKYSREEDNLRYAQALRAFQEEVNLESEAAIERTVKDFARAGFDMGFFATYGNAKRDYRMALAWVYSEVGTAEDALKAVNLAWSLTDGPGQFTAEEDSEEWWEAQVVRLRAYLRGAQALLKATPGSPSPQAVEWVNLGSGLLKALNVQFPRLGKDERPETPGEVATLLAQLQVVRQQANLRPLNIVLGRIAAENAENAEGDAPKDGN